MHQREKGGTWQEEKDNMFTTGKDKKLVRFLKVTRKDV